MIEIFKRGLRKERGRRLMIKISVACFSFSMIFLVFLTRYSNFSPRIADSYISGPENRWLEISIPNSGNSEKNSQFRYTNLINSLITNCIPRAKFAHEFSRNIKIDPYSYQSDKPYTFVFGANTALGQAICNELSKRHEPFIRFNGIIDYDATAVLDILPKGMINVSKAIICIQTPQTRAVSSSDKQETKKLSYLAKIYSEYFTRARIPYIIAMQPPYSTSFIQLAEWFEKPLIFVPFLSNSANQYDIENPFIRAAQECNLYGKTSIDKFNGYTVTNINPNIIASYILDHPILDKKDTIRIVTKDGQTVPDVLNAMMPNCNITYTERLSFDIQSIHNIKAHELKSKPNIIETVAENIKKLPNSPTTKPYLSIVVPVSEHDKDHIRSFLYTIDQAAGAVPLANFELIIINYMNGDSFIQKLNIGSNIRGKVRVIDITEQIHNEYVNNRLYHEAKYLKNLAKNIGIRRSKGEFVLVINPDELIPAIILEYVAGHFFTDGTLYRANRMDVRCSYVKTLNDSSTNKLLNSPWEFPDNNDIAPHCFYQYDGPIIITKDADLRKYMICSTSDFVLASKNLWDAVSGFPEFGSSKDPDGEVLANFMKLAPGVILHYLRDPILHLNDDLDAEIPPLGEESEYRRQMVCSGRSSVLNPENKNYGLLGVSLNEHQL